MSSFTSGNPSSSSTKSSSVGINKKQQPSSISPSSSLNQKDKFLQMNAIQKTMPNFVQECLQELLTSLTPSHTQSVSDLLNNFPPEDKQLSQETKIFIQTDDQKDKNTISKEKQNNQFLQLYDSALGICKSFIENFQLQHNFKMAQQGIQQFLDKQAQNFQQKNAEHMKLKIRLNVLQLALRFFDHAHFREEEGPSFNTEKSQKNMRSLQSIQNVGSKIPYNIKPQATSHQEWLKGKLQEVQSSLSKLHIMETMSFTFGGSLIPPSMKPDDDKDKKASQTTKQQKEYDIEKFLVIPLALELLEIFPSYEMINFLKSLSKQFEYELLSQKVSLFLKEGKEKIHRATSLLFGGNNKMKEFKNQLKNSGQAQQGHKPSSSSQQPQTHQTILQQQDNFFQDTILETQESQEESIQGSVNNDQEQAQDDKQPSQDQTFGSLGGTFGTFGNDPLNKHKNSNKISEENIIKQTPDFGQVAAPQDHLQAQSIFDKPNPLVQPLKNNPFISVPQPAQDLPYEEKLALQVKQDYLREEENIRKLKEQEHEFHRRLEAEKVKRPSLILQDTVPFNSNHEFMHVFISSNFRPEKQQEDEKLKEQESSSNNKKRKYLKVMKDQQQNKQNIFSKNNNSAQLKEVLNSRRSLGFLSRPVVIMKPNRILKNDQSQQMINLNTYNQGNHDDLWLKMIQESEDYSNNLPVNFQNPRATDTSHVATGFNFFDLSTSSPHRTPGKCTTIKYQTGSKSRSSLKFMDSNQKNMYLEDYLENWKRGIVAKETPMRSHAMRPSPAGFMSRGKENNGISHIAGFNVDSQKQGSKQNNIGSKSTGKMKIEAFQSAGNLQDHSKRSSKIVEEKIPGGAGTADLSMIEEEAQKRIAAKAEVKYSDASVLLSKNSKK